jgi:hypothetical protein
MKKILLAALALTFASTGAWALTADGVTYTLTETLVSSTLADFTLAITGINGPSDTEGGGRSGVQSFALNNPSNSTVSIASSTAPTGFTMQTGGLNSGGCDGKGNFFCFKANTFPATTPALAANSSLSFAFAVALSSGSFAGYLPDFKINWIGSQNNYDLVSKALAPVAATPLPASWTMMLSTLVIGLGFMFSRRARRGNGALIPAAA